MKNLRAFAAAAALLTAGCSGAVFKNQVTSWPPPAPNAPAAAPTGVLFKLNVDADMKGTHIDEFILHLPLLSEAGDGVDAGLWQTLIVQGNDLNKFPNDVVFLPLKPGEYYPLSSGITYTSPDGGGHQMNVLNDEETAHFTLEPGKIRVLGSMSITLTDSVLSNSSSGGQTRRTTYRFKSDVNPAKKLEVVEAALARPEADKLGWRDALEAARAAVAAEGEFGEEFFLKPWPSRAPAPGAPVHAATGVVLKLVVDAAGSELPLEKINFYFHRSDLADDAKVGWVTRAQHVAVTPDQFNKFPGDVMIIPLKPGKYPQMPIEFRFNNDSNYAVGRAGGDFASFEVKPGQLTVLEPLKLSFKAHKTTLPDGRPGVQSTTDVSPGVKAARADRAGHAKVVDEALGKPEAATLNWNDALEAAKKALE